MSRTKESLQKQRETWKKHIAKFRASGLTTREWSDKYKAIDLSDYES